MSTILKGNATEAAVLAALTERDLQVLTPFGDGRAYDLAVDIGGRIVRVQCKTARVAKGCVIFNSRSTDHGNGQGNYVGLADIFGVMCPPLAAIYLIPVLEVPTSVVYLRHDPARNNQRKGIRLARQYELRSMSDQALRDLLERCLHPPHRPALTLVEREA